MNPDIILPIKYKYYVFKTFKKSFVIIMNKCKLSKWKSYPLGR
jgi:hypothetical protein